MDTEHYYATSTVTRLGIEQQVSQIKPFLSL